MQMKAGSAGKEEYSRLFGNMAVSSPKKMAEEARQGLAAYYRSQKALTPGIEAKIGAFCDWLSKKGKNWLIESLSKDLSSGKLEICSQEISPQEILGAYLGMKYLFESEAIAGKKAVLPKLVLGDSRANAGGYSPDKHTIYIAGAAYLSALEEPERRRAFSSGTEKGIVMFNIAVHESAHSFRKANGLDGVVTEIGTYLAQTKYGFPVKNVGSAFDYILGQRCAQNVVRQEKEGKLAEDSANSYFGGEYLEYIIGPFMERYFGDRGLALPEFYGFAERKIEIPKSAETGAASIKEAFEKILSMTTREVLDNIVQYLGVPDKGFNDEIKKAYSKAIQERLGVSDAEIGAVLDMPAREVAEKYIIGKADKAASGKILIRAVYDNLEKSIGTPKDREIPDGFGYRAKNATEFFA